MNFYKRYPADYGRKTARLTLAQHGAYTLLLDELYGSEQSLPGAISELFRICRAMSKPDRKAVLFIAEIFFPIGPDGRRHNKRATEELIEAAPAIAAARANGAMGGRPRQTKPSGFAEQNPVGSSEETQKLTQTEPSSKPPQTLRVVEKRTPPPPKGGEGRFPEFWTAWPNTDRKVDRKKCVAKWRRERLDEHADEILVHVAQQKTTRKWSEGFEPAPLRYLNGEQWRDGVTVAGGEPWANAI